MDNAKRPAYPNGSKPEAAITDDYDGFDKLERVALQLLPDAILRVTDDGRLIAMGSNLSKVHQEQNRLSFSEASRMAYEMAECFLAVPETDAQRIRALEERVCQYEALLYQAADSFRYMTEQPEQNWRIDDATLEKLKSTLASITAELERREEDRGHG